MKENIEANKEKGILSKTCDYLDCPVFWRKDYELSTPDVEKQMLF
jgi:DNA polymerase-1